MPHGPRIAAALGLVVAIGLAVALWPRTEPLPADPVTPPEPAPEALEATRESIAARPLRLPRQAGGIPVEPLDEADHAPGRAFRSDRPDRNSTAGEIDPLPPASAAIWEERRAEMADRWEAETLAAAAAFAEQEGLSEQEREGVVSVLKSMHAKLDVMRAAIESGGAPLAETRERMTAAKMDAKTEMVRVLGQERAAAFAAFAEREVHGGAY